MVEQNIKELGEFAKKLQVISFKKAYSLRELPEKKKKEIMILGKSNVGKSSLINSLLNRKIARTSKEAGCTRWLGFIELNCQNSIVDLPGFGFSNVSKGRKIFWDKMISQYINSKRADEAWILIDSRRGIQKNDIEIVNFLKNDYPIFLVYTKVDCKDSHIPSGSLAVSAKNGTGLNDLREILAE